MTKLNYANRKSEGVKLGVIIDRDLGRRNKTPGSAKAPLTPIDLNLEGKNLTDDGIATFASTLAQVLTPRQGALPAKLQILHLQHNALTTRSLALLAPSIAATADTLEDLDLSNNSICLDNEENKEEWRMFLQSFSCCTALRHLNLACNDLSNFQAFEALAEVYMRQLGSYAMQRENSDDVSTMFDELAALSLRDDNVPPLGSGPMMRASTDPMKIQIRGLPSIPVISFDNVSMSDEGALSLTWVVESHKWVQVDICRRLWSRHREESERAQIEIGANQTLSATGLRLLSDAETVPFHPFQELDNENEAETMPSVRRRRSLSTASVTTPSRRVSGVGPHHRKQSTDTQESTSTPPAHRTATYSEMHNLRKRTQRAMIEKHGIQPVRLWHAALRLLILVRHTMLREASESTDSPVRGQGRASDSPTASEGPNWPSLQPMTPHPASTYASKLRFERTRGSPVLSILEDARNPTTPAVLKPVQHHRTSSTQSTPQAVADVTGTATVTPVSELTGAIRMDTPQSQPRMIGPLPEKAWVRVLVLLADPHRVLAEKHVEGVVAYAEDRRTLGLERELVGKSRSVRIWKVLELMGCLMY